MHAFQVKLEHLSANTRYDLEVSASHDDNNLFITEIIPLFHKLSTQARTGMYSTRRVGNTATTILWRSHKMYMN